MPDWNSIAEQLRSAGVHVSGSAPRSAVHGGDISDAWRIAADFGDVFLKTGTLDSAQQFAAEAEGLSAINATKTIRVPELLAVGATDRDAFLALEWIQFEPSDASAETRLGEQLAELHAITQPHYGWHRDNSIGRTPQCNAPDSNWANFFREHRLGFQLRLARQNGYGDALQERGAELLERLPDYLGVSEVEPSLLHGDLWGGNWASAGGHPVIFDPAVYFGDREADIAMTRLFGGFGAAFYSAYESHWPRRDAYDERQCIYQLYHVLNHLNLFGRSYLGRALQLMDEVL